MIGCSGFMRHWQIAAWIAVAALFIASRPAVASAVEYSEWEFNSAKDYYWRRCSLPAGGHQYLIYYKSRPQWVYWYNPAKEVVWGAYPTVNHPTWGRDARSGKDLFLLVDQPARLPADCKFPTPTGDNFVAGKAQDKDGKEVALTAPPADLP